MRALFLQHVPFEGPGSIEAWLASRAAALGVTRLFANEPLPPLEDVDFVIAGGGPMSVNDEADLPWLRAEKQFIREAIERGTPVLGICLGAQLIASSLGARVHANPVREIGWFPVHATPVPDGCFRFPSQCTVFHWHGETFDLPEGAVRLARSEACANQAFQIGRRAIGLQFHLETTPQSAASLIENSRHEMTPGLFVQTEADLAAVPAGRYPAINALMEQVLDYLTAAD